MNELKESIDILVKTLYIRDDSSFIFLDDLLTEKTGVFYYFLLRNTSSSKRYLKTLIVDSMKSLFGNQVVEDGTRGKRRGFRQGISFILNFQCEKIPQIVNFCMRTDDF